MWCFTNRMGKPKSSWFLDVPPSFQCFKKAFLQHSSYPSAQDRFTKRRWTAAWLSKGMPCRNRISRMISEMFPKRKLILASFHFGIRNWRGSAFYFRFEFRTLAKSALSTRRQDGGGEGAETWCHLPGQFSYLQMFQTADFAWFHLVLTEWDWWNFTFPIKAT